MRRLPLPACIAVFVYPQLLIAQVTPRSHPELAREADSIRAAYADSVESPGFGTISMDSLTKLREDSIRTHAHSDPNCRFNENVVHQLARQEIMATDSLALIACGQVWVGMPSHLIFRALGAPESRNRTTTEAGTSTQWVFRSGTKFIYLYTEEGRVTAIQD